MQPHRLLAAFAAGALSLAIAMAPAMAAERIVVGQTFIADGTDPGRGANGWSLTTHGVGEALFTVDRDGRVVPLLATSVVPDDGMSWLVKLRPDRRFADGSLATIAYTALGDTASSKERIEAYAGGWVATIEDFRSLIVVRDGKAARDARSQDKGFGAALGAFAQAVAAGGPAPVDEAELVETSLATIAILDSLQEGRRIDL